jgi:hypothetical protein
LQGKIAQIDAQIGFTSDFLPRLFLLETEYQRAVFETELTWVRGVLNDLRAGSLTWDEASLRALAEKISPMERGEA